MGLCIQEQKGELYQLEENNKYVWMVREEQEMQKEMQDMYKDSCYRGMLCWIGKPVQFWSALMILQIDFIFSSMAFQC